ncbi:hypothetical protein LXA43DRAFT_1077239 [Ganoderma leucocontextum]|nr:hypothetical protein LXA43DRAFT_1077239 [Ganoderma leucocontextum]
MVTAPGSTVLGDGTQHNGRGENEEKMSQPNKHKNKCIDGLPVELLLDVFRYVLPPSRLLDPVYTRGTHTPWTRAMTAKATIVQVNRHWHSVVLTLLYEEASLRRSAQVRSFADALRGNAGLPHLVKTIVFDCTADTGEERNFVFSDLVYILTRCTRLRTLIFTDALFVRDVKRKRDLGIVFADSLDLCQYAIPMTLIDAVESVLSRTLVRFEHWPQGGATTFTRHSMAWPVHRFTASPHLTTLAIHVDNPAALERIVLASLDELDLSRDYVTPRDWDRSKYFLSWELPRLRHLVLPVMSNIHGSFLQRFGKSITYLEFRDHLDLHMRYVGGPPTPPTDHIHFCPSLQHLVLQADDQSSIPRLPSLPTPAYIDLWFYSPAGHLRYDLVAARSHGMVGRDIRAQNVRFLDRALHGIPGLPELFPPGTPEDELPRVHAISGLSITHAAWGVYRSDLDELFPPAQEPWDSEPDSEEEYGEWDCWVLPGHSDCEPEDPEYSGSSEDEGDTESEGDCEEPGLLAIKMELGDTDADEEL